MLRSYSIRSKLLIVYISITGVVLATAFVIIMRIDSVSIKENIISGLNVVAEMAADRIAVSIVFSDNESAQKTLASLKHNPSIVYACIRTIDDHIFAEYRSKIERNFSCEHYNENSVMRMMGNYVDVFKLVSLGENTVGTLQIKSSLNELDELLQESLRVSIVMFFILMLISAVVSKYVMSMITGPITRLKDIAKEISENKDYSLRMEKQSTDEVGVLVESFNNMLDQIVERDNALIEEKEKAQASALSAKRYARQTDNINIDLENEIRERARIEEELQNFNEKLEEKVQERTSELKQVNEKIGELARNSGMAEVASGVLHNVGNVLNSVNVSVSVIRDKIRNSRADNIQRAAIMLEQNKGDLSKYISEDEKGKNIPKFLSLLAEQLSSEKEDVYTELDELSKNVDHIKNIISMQQSYAGSYGVREKITIADLIEDAIKINLQGMERHGIEVLRKYNEVPFMYMDKHKALQILINIISNAKYALIDSNQQKKILSITISGSDTTVDIEVNDNGVGIATEDIQHLFEYGFKKRRGGHGYGLHHSALVANELGGSISVASDGPGKGACFTLTLPVDKQPDV